MLNFGLKTAFPLGSDRNNMGQILQRQSDKITVNIHVGTLNVYSQEPNVGIDVITKHVSKTVLSQSLPSSVALPAVLEESDLTVDLLKETLKTCGEVKFGDSLFQSDLRLSFMQPDLSSYSPWPTQKVDCLRLLAECLLTEIKALDYIFGVERKSGQMNKFTTQIRMLRQCFAAVRLSLSSALKSLEMDMPTKYPDFDLTRAIQTTKDFLTLHPPTPSTKTDVTISFLEWALLNEILLTMQLMVNEVRFLIHYL